MATEAYLNFEERRRRQYKAVNDVNPDRFLTCLNQSWLFLQVFFYGIRIILEDRSISLLKLSRDERKAGVILSREIIQKVATGRMKTASLALLYCWAHSVGLSPVQVYDIGYKAIKSGRVPRFWSWPVPAVF